ncbi:MAG: hypothetical protein KC656_31000, partial [Myxococcales bacterium]|nr:hypothetical protein [Myxococcales bacterium]
FPLANNDDDVPWSMSSDLDAVSRAFYRLQAVETRLCVRRFDDGAWACETMTHGKATAQVLANGAPLTSTRDTRDKLTPAILSIAPAGVWSATGFQRWGWNHGTRFCGGLRVGFSGDGDSTDSRDSAIGIGFHLENHICNPADYRALDYGAGFYHYPWPGHPEPWVAPLPVRVWMR